MAKAKLVAVSTPSNDGKHSIDMSVPYAVHLTLQGTSDLLFHRWSCEDVEEKANASKNSAAKKTDNIDAYLWKDEKGKIDIHRTNDSKLADKAFEALKTASLTSLVEANLTSALCSPVAGLKTFPLLFDEPGKILPFT